MPVFTEILLIYAVAAATLFYTGYGLTKLLLPDDLREYELFLMPFVGYAAMVVVAYYAISTIFNLSQATFMILSAASLINFCLLLRKRERFLIFHHLDVVVLFLALGLFLLGIAPLLRYGYLTTIGENWDTELYIPLAEYLKNYTLHTLPTASANPLVRSLNYPRNAALVWGFAYFHSMIGVLLNRDSFETFAVLLSLLRSLSLLAMYVFYRVTLKTSHRVGVFAISLLSLNGLLLWATYFNFGMHVTSLGLLPLAVSATACCLERRDLRSILFGALMVSSLPLTFHPAFIAYLFLAGAVVGYLLISRPQRAKTLLAGLSMASVSITLSFFAHLRFFSGFLRLYWNRPPAAGVTQFVPLSSVYGLSFFLPPTVAPSPLALRLDGQFVASLEGLATWLVVLISLFALLRMGKDRKVLWWLIAISSAIYVSTLRFVIDYPYGYLKGMTLIVFVLVALAAQGVASLWQRIQFSLSLYKALLPSFVALLLSLSGLNAFLTVRQYFNPRPVYFDHSVLELGGLRKVIKPDSEIYLSDDSRLQGVLMGMIIYQLRDYELYGNIRTAYTSYERLEPGRVYDYGLLHITEDPGEKGYRPEDLIWANELVRVYQRGQPVVYHRSLRSEGGYPRLSDEEPWVLTVWPHRLGVGGESEATAAQARRQVVLALATFSGGKVSIRGGGLAEIIELKAGLSTYRIPPLASPTELELRSQGEEPVYVRWVRLLEPAGDEALLMPQPEVALVRYRTSFQDQTAETEIELYTPPASREQQRDLLLTLDIWGRPEGTHTEEPFGWWGVKLGEATRLRLKVNLAEKEATVWADGVSLPMQGQHGPLQDGDYTARLWFYHEGKIINETMPVYTFRVRDGQVTEMNPHDTEISFIHLPLSR